MPIAIKLEVVATSVEAIVVIRAEAIAIRVEVIAIRFDAVAVNGGLDRFARPEPLYLELKHALIIPFLLLPASNQSSFSVILPDCKAEQVQECSP